MAFYGVFGTQIKGNVIENLPATGWPYLLARLLYALLMLASLPLQSFPARSAILKLLPSSFAESRLAYISTTVGILLLSWAVASLGLRLDLIMGVVGCTAGPVICYFLPALFWWRLDEYGEKQQRITRGRISCLVLAAFGVIAVLVPLVAIILSRI